MIHNHYDPKDLGAPDPKDELGWFERAIYFHGLSKATVILLRYPNNDREWSALRKLVVDKPYGAEHMDAYLSLCGTSEPGNIALADAIEVGVEGGKYGRLWAVAVAKLIPSYAKELAGKGDWLRRVFDDSVGAETVDLIRNNPGWVPVWQAMAKRWQGRDIMFALDTLPAENREREYLGVGIVHFLGGAKVEWNLDFIDSLNQRLEGALTIHPHLSDFLTQQPFMGKLGAAVHKSVLGQVAGNDDRQPHDPGSRPRM